MASPQEIKATVSARVGYEEDFTFEKKKEELAQFVRSDVGPRVSKILGGGLAKVSIDADGDITINMKDIAYVYLTGSGATCSASNIALSLIPTSPFVRSVPHVMAELHQLRSAYLKPISYALRVFVTFWYPNPPSIDNLRSHFFSPLRQFSDGDITNLSCNLSYNASHFRDTLEVDTKVDQVAARFMRDADATEFADFADFWDKARIAEALTKLAPFFEPLDRAQAASLSKLLASEK